jgi:hypothetical protein
MNASPFPGDNEGLRPIAPGGPGRARRLGLAALTTVLAGGRRLPPPERAGPPDRAGWRISTESWTSRLRRYGPTAMRDAFRVCQEDAEERGGNAPQQRPHGPGAAAERRRHRTRRCALPPLDAPAGALQPPEGSLGPATLDPARLTEPAAAQRPDLAAARANALAADALALEPKLRFLPTRGLSGQFRLADSTIAGDRSWDTTIVLDLSWTIWDAGIRAAAAEAKRAAFDTATLQVRALRRKVGADIRNGVAALLAARDALTAAAEGVAAARLSADETDVLYKQGLAKAIELLDANLSRFTAELGLAAAQLGLRSAELDLRAALGLLPLDGVS